MRRALVAALRAVATLGGVWMLLQWLPRWLPEDPARIAAGEWASESEVAALRHLLRLDLPIHRALGAGLRELMHGSFGESLRFHRPVADLLRQGLPVSLCLALMSILLSILLAWAWARPDSRVSAWVRSAAVASPVYVSGPLLLWAVAQNVSWIPVVGIQPGLRGWATWILPCLALAIPLAGHQARILSTQLEALQHGLGLRVWEAAGIPPFLKWRKWLLPAVAGPWLTVLGLQLGGLLGGAVLTETIFGLPGLGQQMVGAISTRDLPLLQGTVMLGAALYVAVQLLVEWAHELLDPRLR